MKYTNCRLYAKTEVESKSGEKLVDVQRNIIKSIDELLGKSGLITEKDSSGYSRIFGYYRNYFSTDGSHQVRVHSPHVNSNSTKGIVKFSFDYSSNIDETDFKSITKQINLVNKLMGKVNKNNIEKKIEEQS